MPESVTRSPQYDEIIGRLLAVAPLEATDATTGIVHVLALVDEINQRELDPHELSGLLFSASSLLINCGSRAADRSAIRTGRSLAEKALVIAIPHSHHAFECQYNIANSMIEECYLDMPATDGDRNEWEQTVIAIRLGQRETLREARAILFAVSEADEADSRTRSAACCNLANALDTSGRWAEAYNFYLRALEIRPDNGNAAGNLAQLLQFRIASGIGQTGHLAAVHDHYVRLAQTLHDGTTRFAGADIAEQWDRLQSTDSSGHFAHGLDSDDEYKLWVADQRLALSPVVEGLGTENSRWDIAVIEQLYGKFSEPTMPAIIGEMNVLKADYLVSRRLAFDGAASIEENNLAQPDSDTGYYLDTLDYSLYGTQYSALFLAQRSTLDVLDKTAVVANEYFVCGLKPDKVSFRTFWTDQPGQIRSALIKAPGRAFPALALAELAIDMGTGGMYSDSQALRNAGTHRIVHATLLDATGVTRGSCSSIDVLKLMESTVLALQVTRSAYLYLIDLVTMWNHPHDHPGVYVPLPTLEYDARSHDQSDHDSHEVATPRSPE